MPHQKNTFIPLDIQCFWCSQYPTAEAGGLEKP